MPAACEQERILSVTELTDRMRRTLEGAFPFVWVRGEIGELSFPGSGHIYFTLKDAGAQLQCVWFRDRQIRGRNFDPLTGEIFAEPRPEPVRLLRQGSELFCAGQISVYGPRGRYQLIVELVQAGGQGLRGAQTGAGCPRFFCRGAQTSAACQSQPRGAGDVTCRGCHP